MDRRTDEEKREQMLADREIVQKRAQDLVVALHEEGFYSLWIASTQLSGDGRFWQMIVIDSVEIDHARMMTIYELGEIHGASIQLKEIHMNQERFSRIVLWPGVGRD